MLSFPWIVEIRIPWRELDVGRHTGYIIKTFYESTEHSRIVEVK